ncbi:DUF4097 family beta strand repeat-containing protein [Horticoccus sp. 23ND18S-11]|uniref:DUF4097 family beta strand repeat-containing protein n=1 Tax=Horticoccus sp. 23ND18S-11 TaxID=3391832 RepID=UPI0039C94D76
MKISIRHLVFAGLMSASVLVAHARIERVVEKSFPVSGAGTLRVETQGGGIRVTPAADNVIRVTVTQRINASTEAEADELLKKLELTFEPAGNDLRVVAKYEKKPIGFTWGSWPPVAVDLAVSLPAAYATQLNTSGGAITVGDLLGHAVLRTSGGSIKLGRMGGTVDAHTSGGAITLAAARGRVELKTSGGNIAVGDVQGPAELSTSGGGIKVDNVAGALNAHTSGGSIRAGITGPIKEACTLSTSGGSVTVSVDKSAAFQLDASTSGGGVDASGLTITLESTKRDRSRLAGAVNGGGPLLKLRSSGGGISVRAN